MIHDDAVSGRRTWTGAYFEYIGTIGSHNAGEQQYVLSKTNFQDMDHLNYYLTGEIRYGGNNMLTNDPSTLTRSVTGDRSDAMGGLEGILAMANGTPDYHKVLLLM
jgi:hypothetical protein